MVAAASGTNTYAKEMAIRRRIANIFNKREDDFPSLREYNDYLEEVEEMTFKLVEGIDAPAIEAKIAKYHEENVEQIINSRARKAEELAAALATSKCQPAQTAGIDAGVGQSAQAAGTGHYAPAAVPGMQPRPTGGAPQPVPIGGGPDPDDEVEDEEKMKLRARAGGWTMDLSKRRAFEEAFSTMWI